MSEGRTGLGSWNFGHAPDHDQNHFPTAFLGPNNFGPTAERIPRPALIRNSALLEPKYVADVHLSWIAALLN